jgi:hypothetical protein
MTLRENAINLLQTAQYFCIQHNVPLTVEDLETAYNCAKNYGYTPAYILQEAVTIAINEGLFHKVPTHLILY